MRIGYKHVHVFPPALTSYKLSIIPAIFQEANYYDINWTDKNEDLRFLATIFDLDCMFQNNGKTRIELTDSEFSDYVNFCIEVINLRTNKAV